MKVKVLALTVTSLLSSFVVSAQATPAENLFFVPNATAKYIEPQESDFQALRVRWAQEFLGDPSVSFDETLKQMVINTNNNAKNYWQTMQSAVNSNGLWLDLTLDNQTEEGKIKLGANIRTSYQRLLEMTKAFRLRDGELQNNASLLSSIIEGMTFLNQFYKEGGKEWGNWWHWELGTPRDIHNILILLFDQLPSELITAHTQATRYFTPIPTHLGVSEGASVSSNPNYRESTGGNRTDNALVVLLRGVIDNNNSEIEQAISSLSAVLEEVKTSDGFYSDGSFIQHYDIAYNGTYGNVLLNGLGAQLNLVAGSPWEANDPILQNIYPIIFKSYVPILFKGSILEFVNGRAISRPKEQGHDVGHDVIGSLLHYLDGATPEVRQKLADVIKSQITQDTFKDFFASFKHVKNYQTAKTLMLDNNIKSDRGEKGFYQYPQMDRVVFRDEDWSFSLAMHSSRVGNFECMNNENKKGWFTSDGMSYLHNNQLDHYYDYWASVNPYRLEGTTVDNQIMQDCEGQRNQIKGDRKYTMDWVGSVKLGDYGAAGMDFTNWDDTLSAKKSWFMFDKQIVMLGSDISSITNQLPTTTVINRKLTDDTEIFINGNELSQQSSNGKIRYLTLENPMLDDADISYVFLKPTIVNVSKEKRVGDWSEVGTSSGEVSQNYVSGSLTHTVENNSYAYVLLPNADVDDAIDYLDDDLIKIKQQDAVAHVVINEDSDIIAGNIWQESDVILSRKITALDPMAIMIQKNKKETTIAVSDPTQKQKTLQLKLNKQMRIIADVENRIGLNEQGILTINLDGLNGQSYSFSVK